MVPTVKKMTDAERKIMNKAFRLLKIRPHTRQELIRKLTARGYSYREAAATVAECERLGFVNDELFAEDYLRELAGRGQGERMIRMKMWRKGLPEQLIEEKLSEFRDSSSAAERAAKVLEGKITLLKRESDRFKRRAKAYRFLASRGFDADAIRSALEGWDENN